jgi:hypothetical protein
MRTFPIGTKIKNFVNKINITSQLQSITEKEYNVFYQKNIPLKKEPFDGTIKDKSDTKSLAKNKTKKIKIRIHSN